MQEKTQDEKDREELEMRRVQDLLGNQTLFNQRILIEFQILRESLGELIEVIKNLTTKPEVKQEVRQANPTLMANIPLQRKTFKPLPTNPTINPEEIPEPYMNETPETSSDRAVRKDLQDEEKEDEEDDNIDEEDYEEDDEDEEPKQRRRRV